MTKDQKVVAIAELKEKFEQYSFFYLTDPTTMTVAETNRLRRKCFEEGIEMKMVKNKLAVTALKAAPSSKNYEPLFNSFSGQTAMLFTDTANLPARMLLEMKTKGIEKPLLKAAYVDTAIFEGASKGVNYRTGISDGGVEQGHHCVSQRMGPLFWGLHTSTGLMFKKAPGACSYW